MAFDACMMRAVLSEYKSAFPEAKIEKILQPQNDEIDMVIHHARRDRRLVFNVGPNAPRLQLSDKQKENPQKAPMFCMQLRKLFSGARILSVDQPGFDRIAFFKTACYDEMGFAVTRYIVCEIMGKYANLVILDGEKNIVTALKTIDFSQSTVRQVLPGLKYRMPAQQDKLLPTAVDADAFYRKLAEFPPEKSGEKFITSTYSGIATQIAHELVFRASGQIDTPVCDIDKDSFYRVFSRWQQLLIDEQYSPTVAISREGRPVDYSYMDITYLGDGVTYRKFDDFASLFDNYFAERDRLEHIHQRAKDLTTLLNNAEARTERKLAIQRQALLDSERGEEYKKHADLITANIYKLKRGMESFRAVDYYDDSAPEVEIKLDTRLTPAQNAQKLYKLYNKCKTAKVVLGEQITIWERELKYLESVRAFLDKAEREDDVVELRDELYRAGYASKLKGYAPPKKLKAVPTKLVTSGGFTLLVGKNNTQNDLLSMKTAQKDDLWFHTKDIPGSHVILVTDGQEPGDGDYTEAASVAARFSKASESVGVAVDYTRVRNLRKPAGSKPGFVTYKTNYTAYVSPISDEALAKMKI